MKKIIVWWWKILRFLWAKDTALILEWIKKKKLYWIIKGYKSRNFIYKDITKKLLSDFENYDIFDEKIKKLKKWIDTSSQKNIDDVLYNIDILLQNKHKDFVNFDKLKVEWDKKYTEIVNFLNNLWKTNPYHLSKPDYICATYYSKHWIYEIPNIKEILQWKDCIDCWAYIWDSSVMFLKEFDCSKIYALEPEKENFELLEQTIAQNYVKENIIPLKFWLWDKTETVKIKKDGIDSTIWWDTWETIVITTIDEVVMTYNINPWLIKWDIEWFEYESILWAEKTIKKFKPILNISIYHRGKDFFEIKPLLESWNLWYKFKIIRTKPCDPFVDTVLLCY